MRFRIRSEAKCGHKEEVVVKKLLACGFIAIVTIMFRNLETAPAKRLPCHWARRLASLRPPMPLMAWREELQGMAVGLRSASPLATP